MHTNVAPMNQTHKPEPPSQPVRQHTTAMLCQQLLADVFPTAQVRGDVLILPFRGQRGQQTIEIECESNGAYQFRVYDEAAKAAYRSMLVADDPNAVLREFHASYQEDDGCFVAYAIQQRLIKPALIGLRRALESIVWCGFVRNPKPAVTATEIDRLYGEAMDSLTAFGHAFAQAEADPDWKPEATHDLVIAQARLESLICENGDCSRVSVTRLPDLHHRLCREHADAYEPCSHCGRLFLRGQMQGTEDGWTCAGCEVGR